jgi:hypothetical protein
VVKRRYDVAKYCSHPVVSVASVMQQYPACSPHNASPLHRFNQCHVLLVGGQKGLHT